MDDQIRAIFREEARRIVRSDRSAKKYGYSNNLPGDITSALATAYKLGLDHGRDPDAKKPHLLSSDAAIAWELVPPTSRNILSAITFGFSRRSRMPTFVADELVEYTDETSGRQRWAQIDTSGEPCRSGYSFAKKGIGPLVRLELLAPKDGNKSHLTLTSKGDATCRLYWSRSDRDDPSLPVISMR